MIKRRDFISLIAVLMLLAHPASLRTGAASMQTQQAPTIEERDRAIELYKQGDRNGALKVLEAFTKTHSDDADAWYFLGLAYYDDGAFLPARVALEHLITLRPDSANANARLSYTLILNNNPERAAKAAHHAIELGDLSPEPHYALAEVSFRAGDFAKAIQEANLALQSKSDFAPALITRSLAQASLKQPAEAAASLEQFLALSPDDLDAGVWREQLGNLRKSSETVTSTTPPDGDGPFSGKDVTVKMRVLAKPEPTYTDAARKASVTGTVVLRCVFGSDGQVKSVMVVRALPYGLTSQSAKAARKIEFTPATKDGRPVSMWVQLEYNFNLY